MRAKEISDEASKMKEADHAPEETSVKAIVALARTLHQQLVQPNDLRLRKSNLKFWTSRTLRELMHDVTIKRTDNGETIGRYQYTLKPNPKAKSKAKVLKTIANLLVFEDPRVKTLQHKGDYIIRSLFGALRKDRSLLPLDFQQLLDKGLATQERLVCDFISGMTDRYACAYFGRLFQPGLGSFYEDV
jgi:dGTP triphosphohydrolase